MSAGKQPGLADASASTLVLMDIQTRLTAAMPAKVLARLQRNCGHLIRSASLLDIPVFASEQYPGGLGQLEPEISRLLPGSARCYEKTSFSLAGVPAFLADLAQTGRSQVVLCGMEAHICILQTAIDLVHAGYEVFVVADAVCSRFRESYETALDRMGLSGVAITDSESVLFEWLRDAAQPHFKPLQALIR